MTAQLSVATSARAPYTSGLSGAVTLPESLRRTAGSGELVGLLGAAGWPAEAADAIRAGAKGVLVAQPAAADVAELAALAAERGVPVVLDTLWADNPAVDRSAPFFRPLAEPGALLEARVDLPLRSDLDQAALDQLALIRRALGPVTELRYVRRDVKGYDALGVLDGGVRATFGAILSNSLRTEARIRVIRPTDAVELTVPAPATAAPGRVVVSGPDGETLLETKYESAHRGAWRRLHQLVVSGGSAPDLASFTADLRVLADARPVG